VSQRRDVKSVLRGRGGEMGKEEVVGGELMKQEYDKKRRAVTEDG
jgi:hypothetical protein